MEIERVRDPAGPVIVHRDVHRDARGAFVESWHERRYRQVGIDARFVQVNCSRSVLGVLRGLHFQHPHPQGKLVGATRGEVFDVAVDVRVGSPSFGRWVGVRLSAENGLQLWVPPDFAHGFVALTPEADVLYHCTSPYRPEAEHTLLWSDPEVGIEWPIERPTLSDKDAVGDTLAALRARGALPRFGGAAPSGRRISGAGGVPIVR